MNYYPQQTVIVQDRESNSLGVVGFCLMILGYLTCGVLAIPAAFLCGFAMFKEPRGLAIAGFILSLPACLGLLAVVGMFFLGVIGQNLAEQRVQSRRQTVQSPVIAPIEEVPMSDDEVAKIVAEYQEQK